MECNCDKRIILLEKKIKELQKLNEELKNKINILLKAMRG